MRIYQEVESVLSAQTDFLKQLEKGSKEAYIILNKELLSADNFVTRTNKLPESTEQAFNMAMKSVCSVYSKYSLEAIKLRVHYGLALVKRECYKQAVE